MIVPAGAASDASRTYTLDAAFDEGVADNVGHTPSDQLQLTDEIPTSPFIWIALSARGTIAKIDTASGTILGEYSTTSDGDDASNPSRTTVTNDGSVWAGNRNQSSAIHVGLSESGGCVDRNGNSAIETSSGYGDVLAWPGGTFASSSPVTDATDECILHYVDTYGGDARHVTARADGNVWIGNFYEPPVPPASTGVPGTLPRRFQLIDNSTGAILQTEEMPCGGYGGLIDRNGVLWSASQFDSKLLRWNPNSATTGDGLAPGSNPRCISINSYGLAFDSNNNIWVAPYSGGVVHKMSPDGTTVQTFSMGTGHTFAQGLAVDGNDHVWISSSNSGGLNSIAHLLNNGTHIGQVQGAGSGSTGVAVDAAGKIWTANINSSDATRIDPTAGAIGADLVTPVGAFDLTVPLAGANPYNYSDMTGSTLTGKPESGTWTVVYDSGIAGAEWGTASWTADTLGGSQIAVTVETSTDGITFGSPVTPSNGGELTVADGRYLRATTTYTRGTNEESPILYDLTLSTVLEGGGDGGDTPSPTTSVSPSPKPTPPLPPSLLGTCRGHAVTIEAIASQITFGTAANDVINGTSGSDTIYGYGRRDIVCGQGGDDTIYGGGGGGGGVFGDELYGGLGNDNQFGDGGDDSLVGGPGDDRLLGRRGNDGFNGGAGIDACNGGAGRDAGKLCEPFDQ